MCHYKIFSLVWTTKKHTANIGVDQNLVTVFCINIDFWETSIYYTNILLNVIVNNSIKLLLKHQWFMTLKRSLTKVHFHLINMSLLSRQMQGNHSVNFLMFWIPSKKKMFAGYVLPNKNARRSEQEMLCGQECSWADSSLRLFRLFRPFTVDSIPRPFIPGISLSSLMSTDYLTSWGRALMGVLFRPVTNYSCKPRTS